jgi:hypothetical protein
MSKRSAERRRGSYSLEGVRAGSGSDGLSYKRGQDHGGHRGGSDVTPRPIGILNLASLVRLINRSNSSSRDDWPGVEEDRAGAERDPGCGFLVSCPL